MRDYVKIFLHLANKKKYLYSYNIKNLFCCNQNKYYKNCVKIGETKKIWLRKWARGILYFKYIYRILRIHSVAIEINM